MIKIEKIKNIHKQICQTHQDLIKILDSVELEILPENSTKVAIEISVFEDITNLTSKLYDKDLVITKLLKPQRSINSIKNEMKDIKRNLVNMRRMVLENNRHVQKEVKRISLILNEYKERCRNGFIEFLKTLELDLRRTLKPLVPSDVLQEQINFRPIESNPDLLSSMNSNTNEPAIYPTDSTVDKLNNHIQLLVNTLEDVAKSLINITQNTYRSYYELVDPTLLYSEPPSPLAAPLPEYFSYDIGNISEENRKKGNIFLSGKSKERLIQKILAIQKAVGMKTPLTSRKVQDRLETFLTKDLKEADLMQFFKEEGIPVSEREKLVYEIIHSERDGGRDVSLEDIISGNEKKIIEVKRKAMKEVKEVKPVVKPIKEVHPPIRLSSEDYEINTLETYVDDREEISRIRSKPNLIDKKNDVPPLNFKPKNLPDSKDPSLRPRSGTPGKLKKEKKSGKRTKTPVLPKKQRLHK